MIALLVIGAVVYAALESRPVSEQTGEQASAGTALGLLVAGGIIALLFGFGH